MENSIYLKSIPLVFEDHGSKLLKALYEQQKKSQLCDLSLVVENNSFPAHKCVLAAHSDYFYALFDQGKQPDDAGSKACNVTTIHLSSITLNTFIPIFHYLYTSQLHVFSENIRDIMRTARKLQISTVVKACEKLVDDNIVLPSVHEVCNKQSSNANVAQSSSSESVLYVDLRSEDDESFPVSQSSATFQKSEDNFSIISFAESKPKVGRAQKKKGVPKKLHQVLPTQGGLCTQRLISSNQSIPSISPASIFGRVIASSSIKTKDITSPMLPLVSSSDNLSKGPSNALSIDPLPFENNLDAVGTLFGSDSAFIMDNINNESLNSSSNSDKMSILKQSSSNEALHLQSVFSITPKLSTHKSVASSGDWNRLQDALSHPNISPSSILSVAVPSPSFLTSSTSVLQNPSGCTPSVYSCKECLQYFASLADAIHHFYTAHPSTSNSNDSKHQAPPTNLNQSKPIKLTNHSCPDCGRVFSNKNNLKRHILIKHTSDKRFRCSVCGRKYAIRQSLQYHMKSVHGRSAEESKADSANLSSPPSSYAFEPLSSSAKETITSLVDTFSFSVPASSSTNNFVESYEQTVTGSSAGVSSPATYLNNASLLTAVSTIQQTDRNVRNDTNIPTIHVESIRSLSVSEDEAQQSNSEIAISKIDLTSNNESPSTSVYGGSGSGADKSNLSTGENSTSTNNLYAMPEENELPVLISGISSASSSSMNIDQSQNMEVTPRLHRCEHCFRIFSTVHAFTRHKRSCHKHECPICHRGFSQLGNMRRHIKIFHCEQKPYQCHICHKAYGIKQSFRYHMRDKHGAYDAPKPINRSSYMLTQSVDITKLKSSDLQESSKNI